MAATAAVDCVSTVKSQRGKICILAINDDGMRGILAGKALTYLELVALKKKSDDQNATIVDYFDVAVGAGVGDIFTAMLFSIKVLANLLENNHRDFLLLLRPNLHDLHQHQHASGTATSTLTTYVDLSTMFDSKSAINSTKNETSSIPTSSFACKNEPEITKQPTIIMKPRFI